LNEFAPPRQLNRYMAFDDQRRAKAIQESIRQILLRDWDPIGVNDVPDTQDEYDSYVGGVYRLLALHCSAEQMINHLAKIESQTMELGVANREHLMRIANQLIALDVSL
jgi:hypothetical protein